MPDIPASSLAAAESAIIKTATDFGHGDVVGGSSRDLARAALEAAAPLLAEAWGAKPEDVPDWRAAARLPRRRGDLMPKIAVVAGNYAQFGWWCRERGLSPNSPDVLYVSSWDKLRGRTGLRVEYVGTYRDRRDWGQILESIRTMEAHGKMLPPDQDCRAAHCPPGPDGRCEWPRCAAP